MTAIVSNSTGTILLVDDDPLVLRALRRDLEGLGYQLLSVQSVAAAMAALERNKIDLLISDYSMPGPNGLDLLAHVSRDYPQCVRVMLTGHAGLDMALAAINAGHVYHFLTKPWTREELVSIVDRCFHMLRGRTQAAQREVEEKPLKRRAVIGELEMRYPGISQVKREGGAIDLAADYDTDLAGLDLETIIRHTQ